MSWNKYDEEEEKLYLEDARVLHRMTKPRSPLIREYIEDPKDHELIHVIIKKRKGNEWTGSSMIIDTHLCTWLTHDLNQGWVDELAVPK